MTTTFADVDHAEKILLKLWKQCESEELCDAILLAGTKDKRIPAHSSILSAASEYFHGMFASSMRKIISREVEMPYVDGDILQRVVEYCYTGRIVISEEIVVELLETARLLLLGNVATECEKFFAEHLDPNNCLRLALFTKNRCETLFKKARDYSLDNFLEVRETPEFLNLNAEQLSQFLAADDLCVRTEKNVFNSLMRWIEHDRNERGKHIVGLLKLVRMPLLEPSFLIEYVKPICASTECLQIYTEAIEWHLLPGSTILSGKKSTTPRRSDQVLLAITQSESNKRMFIHYYCPQQNAWMKWLKELEYRYGCAVAVMKNYLFIVGGEDPDDNFLNTVICLNLMTMTLEQIAPLNEHRAHCCAAALNGFLYVLGGWNGEKDLSSVEKLDPKTKKWDLMASMSISRCDFGIAVLSEKLYTVGGTNDNVALSSAECYDPIQNVWEFIGSMGESRQLPGVAVANGMIYAVGSYEESKTVERYDTETKQWTAMCSLRKKEYVSDCCTSLHNKVVVCYKNSIEEFNAANNEWKKVVSFKRPNDIYSIFSYCDKLLTSEFVKN